MDLQQSATEQLKVIGAEYTVESGGHQIPQPIVHLFCRDEDRNRRRIDVEGFRPYFMMAHDEFVEKTSDVINDRHVLAVEADLRGVEREFDGDFDGPNDVASWLTGEANETQVYHKPETFDALDGTKLVKIYTIEPAHVGKIRDHWNRTWEADIPFTRRFLISSETYLGIEIPEGADRVRYENWDGHSSSDNRIQEIEPVDDPEIDPRMMVVDIEVYAGDGGFPDPIDTTQPVTSITAYDSYESEYEVWILEHESWADEDISFESTIEAELGTDIADLHVFEHEGSMLENFHQWVLDRDFDIMTAWNAKFDYPYIANRSYEVSAYSIRDWTMFDTNPGAWRDQNDNIQATMDGRVVWDALEAYKKTQYRDLRSYKLEDVARAELGMGKESIDDIDEAWEFDPVDFLTYNVRDVQAVVEIEQSSGLLSLYDNMRQVTGALYNTCHHNGPMLDTLFLRQAYENDIALTTNYEPDQGDYPGAKVFEPVPGIHENVVYPDLACFTPDTDVMTPSGIVSITELDIGDTVYSIDQETGTVTTKPVIDTHAYPEYDGEIVDIQSTRIDFSVSPNHKMLVEDPTTGERSFVEAGDLDGRSYHKLVSEWEYDEHGEGIEEIDITTLLSNDQYDVLARYDVHGHAFRSRLPDGCEKKRANYHHGFFFDGETFTEYQEEITELAVETRLSHPDGTGSTFRPHKFDGDSFIEFLGWYITEGSTYNVPDERTRAVKISQENSDGREQIKSLLDDMGISASETTDGFTIGSDIYGQLLQDLCGDGSFEKQIPDFVFDRASREQKELLFETMMRADGNDQIYYTSSEKLAEDFSRLLVEIGRKPIVRSRRDTEYEISVHKTHDGITTENHIDESTADDGVYCVTVADNHTLLAGKNGKFQWVGQSLYPYIMWTLNISPETLYESKDAYKDDGYTDDDMFTAYIDDRDWKVISSGETVEPSKIDKDKYKGVHDENGNRKKKKGQGFDGIFEPLNEEHPKSKKEIYYVKPDVNEGFIRKTVDLLVDLKYQYKGQDDMYAAVKRVTNSLYGTLGDSASSGKGFRLFNWKLAESITNVGRMVIEFTADEYVRLINDYAQDSGYEPETYLVAGDTDSVQTSIPQAPDYETALDWAERASVDVSGDLYDEFMEREFNVVQDEDEHKMDVEIESLASALFFIQDGDDEETAVKKRYSQHMIWDEDDGWIDERIRNRNNVSLSDYDDGILSNQDPTDNIGIKGFEYVRSDSATVTKEAQLNVLTYILLSDNPADDIYEYLTDLRDEIDSDDYDVGKLGRPKGISNPLDDYGWKSVEELENDSNYTVTETDREHGGRYVATPGPAYRGAKYADDHIPWEDIGAGSKPVRFYVEKVRGNKFPPAYEYDSYPKDERRPDPLEVDRPVDAIAVDDPDRIPLEFVLDKDKMVRKEVQEKMQPILRTIGEDWDGLVGRGRQVGLGQFT